MLRENLHIRLVICNITIILEFVKCFSHFVSYIPQSQKIVNPFVKYVIFNTKHSKYVSYDECFHFAEEKRKTAIGCSIFADKLKINVEITVFAVVCPLNAIQNAFRSHELCHLNLLYHFPCHRTKYVYETMD